MTPRSDEEDRALVVDPGREKTGLAIVRPDGECAHREVCLTDEVVERVRDLIAAWNPSVLVLGDRTGSSAAAERVASCGIPLVRVDEHRSTEEARALYLAHEPARGLSRLLPRGLRVPARPVDDYAAWVLGRRYYAQRQRKGLSE